MIIALSVCNIPRKVGAFAGELHFEIIETIIRSRFWRKVGNAVINNSYFDCNILLLLLLLLLPAPMLQRNVFDCLRPIANSQSRTIKTSFYSYILVKICIAFHFCQFLINWICYTYLNGLQSFLLKISHLCERNFVPISKILWRKKNAPINDNVGGGCPIYKSIYFKMLE